MTAINSGAAAAGASPRTVARRAWRTRAGAARVTVGIAALVLAAPIVLVVLDTGAARESLLALHERRWGILALLLIATASWIFATVFIALRIRHVRRIARRCRLERLATAWMATLPQAPDTPPPPAGA